MLTKLSLLSVPLPHRPRMSAFILCIFTAEYAVSSTFGSSLVILCLLSFSPPRFVLVEHSLLYCLEFDNISELLAEVLCEWLVIAACFRVRELRTFVRLEVF